MYIYVHIFYIYPVYLYKIHACIYRNIYVGVVAGTVTEEIELQIFRQTNFLKSLYIFYTLVHVMHYFKILYKLNMQICICSYG